MGNNPSPPPSQVRSEGGGEGKIERYLVKYYITHGFSLMTLHTEAMAEKQLVMLSSVSEGF